ncbi:hypothetical protein GQ651_12180 [Alphaproteobacteria bacterium GH1-50]|uniref:Uncharacterized protein n=1 Tax=Kangsaoukella pontilimi TaxID=2691042 RepID=A0A7C9ISH8_9RHOB|nr:hypothetical protein [Kangsaoukella pontilimi]MXQ08606.1 hypothetical protein [Kangsaoukella pontilimi]
MRIADDESSAFLSVNGGAEIEFDTPEEGGWSGPAGFLFAQVSGFYENRVNLYSESSYAGGYYGQQTAPEDLLTGDVNFFAYVEFSGEMMEGGYDMNLTMAFESNSISGSIEGGFADYSDEEAPGGSFSGDVTGEMAGSFFAMSSDIAGEGVTGNLGFLGAFYDNGTYIGGGGAGTINGQTVGGEFTGWEEEFFEEGPL